MNVQETDVFTTRIFAGDFIIPRPETTTHSWEHFFINTETAEILLHQPPGLAQLTHDMHVWDEAGIEKKLTEAGIDGEKTTAFFHELRAYWIAFDITHTLSETAILKALGEKRATILKDIDLADRDVVNRILAANPPPAGIISNLRRRIDLHLWDVMQIHRKKKEAALRDKK